MSKVITAIQITLLTAIVVMVLLVSITASVFAEDSGEYAIHLKHTGIPEEFLEDCYDPDPDYNLVDGSTIISGSLSNPTYCLDGYFGEDGLINSYHIDAIIINDATCSVPEEDGDSIVRNDLPGITGNVTFRNSGGSLYINFFNYVGPSEGEQEPQCVTLSRDLDMEISFKKVLTSEEAAAEVTTEIQDLPSVDNITLQDESAIASARSHYDTLSDDAKALVTEETLKLLQEAEKKLDELKKPSQEQPTTEKPSPKQPTAEKPSPAKKKTTAAITKAKGIKVLIKTPKKAKKAFIAKWKPVKGVTGYQVSYSKNRSFKKARCKNVKGASKKSLHIKKLKKKTKYYVKVRSYTVIKGNKIYGKWSKVKSVKTK